MKAAFGSIALKVLLAGIVLVATCLGAAVALTDPMPATLPGRAWAWMSARPARASAPPQARAARADDTAPPVFSDVAFDDSGYASAIRFSGPIADPSSLQQIRESVVGRGRRGVAYLEAKLAELKPGDPSAAKVRMLLGSIWMYEGEWDEAGRQFARAQTDDPKASTLARANLDALRGIAALRRGEVENCVSCCNEASCIFPLAAAAIHRRVEGSREAIEHFTRYLKLRPDDLGIQWLLNVAYMTLGEYPDAVPRDLLLPLGRFVETTDGLARMPNIASRVGLNARGSSMAGACLVDDFDGDGRLDVFMPTTDPERGASLLRNKGDGTFEDVSDSAGLADQVLSLNACHADYDNNGDLDILMLRGGWETPRRMSLLRNKRGGFEDATLAAGLGEPIASQAAGWADYDNDGLVDLYVAGEFDPGRPDPRNRGRLYHNKGDGAFENVAVAAGVTNDRFGKGVAWGDYDDDGFPDLYVSNLGQPNRLYRNNGDGTFLDVASALRVAEPIDSFACWFWDFDNDGRLDLWVNPNRATLTEVIKDQLGMATTGERPRLYRNVGRAEGFRDVTAEVGLDRVVLPMGSNFGDLDNNGFLDIYLGTGRPSYSYLMPNLMFRNVDGRRFEDVTAATGTGHLQKGHGVAFADWDRDGDLDLFVEAGGAAPGDRAHNVLFQNPGHGRHWLTVKLIGTKTNRAALGAKIRVDLPAADGVIVSRHRRITAGSSFGGNPLACTISLGAAETIKTLEVTWPTSSTRQTLHNPPIDRSVEITEGREGFRILDSAPIGSR
ncbi:MAG: FG-GAP-like repeat-containing protein [Paludisphaera borealis]|uniref:FG-GAP-like repeat-containing protein n=1 Tax=Paludisphaera borealis TaxID=1387353 RepID=UPI00283CA384|nr:FG-GAP-like repeat-containing protein [Paludisphaera borealis]MDR3622159.1 FG-GAP-like repeat-containing protein [Paludisphaera borealis]